MASFEADMSSTYQVVKALRKHYKQGRNQGRYKISVSTPVVGQKISDPVNLIAACFCRIRDLGMIEHVYGKNGNPETVSDHVLGRPAYVYKINPCVMQDMISFKHRRGVKQKRKLNGNKSLKTRY